MAGMTVRPEACVEAAEGVVAGSTAKVERCSRHDACAARKSSFPWREGCLVQAEQAAPDATPADGLAFGGRGCLVSRHQQLARNTDAAAPRACAGSTRPDSPGRLVQLARYDAAPGSATTTTPWVILVGTGADAWRRNKSNAAGSRSVRSRATSRPSRDSQRGRSLGYERQLSMNSTTAGRARRGPARALDPQQPRCARPDLGRASLCATDWPAVQKIDAERIPHRLSPTRSPSRAIPPPEKREEPEQQSDRK